MRGQPLTKPTMASSTLTPLSRPCCKLSTLPPKPTIPHCRTQLPCISKSATSSSSSPSRGVLYKGFTLASAAVLLWSSPAQAGFMSGITGIESIPGPKLPPVEFLSRFNEENQKKYAEADARFKSSPLLKKLLEQSQKNKEKNQRGIQDKYCLRGAEWGVGDCSAAAMSPEERENFIEMLKQKAEANK